MAVALLVDRIETTEECRERLLREARLRFASGRDELPAFEERVGCALGDVRELRQWKINARPAG
jgi:hypothetical protein